MSIKYSTILNKASKEFKSTEELKGVFEKNIPTHEQIAMLRNAFGMTQQQLAKRLGYESYVPVSKLEKEGSNPTVETLEKYAAALGCELIIRFAPKESIEGVRSKLAEKIARGIVKLSAGNADMELQRPGSEAIEKAVRKLKEQILNSNKRGLLWED